MHTESGNVFSIADQSSSSWGTHTREERETNGETKHANRDEGREARPNLGSEKPCGAAHPLCRGVAGPKKTDLELEATLSLSKHSKLSDDRDDKHTNLAQAEEVGRYEIPTAEEA